MNKSFTRLAPNGEALTFDDVLLVPGLSDIDSRHDVLLTSGKLGLDLPIISANMDTVTEENMAIAMTREGGMGIIHRFLTQERLDQIIKRCKATKSKFFVSLGINGDSDELFDVARANKVTNFCVDVAHGHHKSVYERVRRLRQVLPDSANIIAGNVATPHAVEYLAEAGANIIKVGIGPGSHCTTRVVTGHGYPQLTAIYQCAVVAKQLGAEVIADGGIRNSGDIAKAIAAGADYVMVGRLLAGCDESPGDMARDKLGRTVKVYRGMASFDAQSDRGRDRSRIIEEGVASRVVYSGRVEDVIRRLRGGLASALSYTGAHTIDEFQEKARFIRVTHNSYIEGTPHGA